ncbi:hypothetical protein JX265_010494 [Neoarthrinium moseri]|uniref:Fucose-specific lectin n=1 Tax=Neoarthrinium moseri TaxID=1658444 RepID=A0A9Q0AKG2_9PEZI|nr:hypothetical protein JX265_010494 [Neoarthrinium moseri]
MNATQAHRPRGLGPEEEKSNNVPRDDGDDGKDIEEGLEVDYTDGGIEVINAHAGMEVHRNPEYYRRPSIPVSALTELPSRRFSDEVGDVSHPEPRVCGIGKQWFWALVVLVIFIVGALIGGLVGGLKKRDTPSSAPVSSLPSNLAAVNWTTAENTTSYVIFTQEADLSLMAYFGDTKSWRRVNISEKFKDIGSLAVGAATPLAAVAMADPINTTYREANYLSLFFVTPENWITQIVTNDTELQDWHWGSIGSHSDVSITVASGSKLAATWVRCNNSTLCSSGCVSLSFEDEQQNYIVVNSTYHWSTTLANKRLARNSSMAMISMNDQVLGNDSDYAWAFYSTNGIVSSTWQDYQSHTWWWTDLGRNILSDMQPTTLQQFAATSFRDRKHAFLGALYSNGSIVGKHYDPDLENWHIQAEINLVDSPPTNFSTIAMTADARLYGISNGTIQEYQMDVDDPYTFQWLGGVQ